MNSPAAFTHKTYGFDFNELSWPVTLLLFGEKYLFILVLSLSMNVAFSHLKSQHISLRLARFRTQRIRASRVEACRLGGDKDFSTLMV